MFRPNPGTFSVTLLGILLMLPISVGLAQSTLTAPNQKPDTPFCFMERPSGQSINLEKICGASEKAALSPIDRNSNAIRRAQLRRANRSSSGSQTATPDNYQPMGARWEG
jgi:hypothetical protein